MTRNNERNKDRIIKQKKIERLYIMNEKESTYNSGER